MVVLSKVINSIWLFIKRDSIICGVISNLIFLWFTTSFIEHRKEQKALKLLKSELESIYNKYYAIYNFLTKFLKISENDMFSYDVRVQHCKHGELYLYFKIPYQFKDSINEVNYLLRKIKEYSCFAFLSSDVQFVVSCIDKDIAFLYNFACTMVDGTANARCGLYNSICSIKKHIQLINDNADKNNIVLEDTKYYDLSNEEIMKHRQQFTNYQQNKKIKYEANSIIINGVYMVQNNHCNFD